jgi:DNA-binding transcriptional regulator YiaG
LILRAFKPKISKVLTKAPENPITLGEKIRKRRIELGLFQKELALMLEVTEDTLRNWEKDRCQPNGRVRLRLIQILNFEIN